MILNACVKDHKMVDENICKNCFDKECSHAGELTTAERLARHSKLQGGNSMKGKWKVTSNSINGKKVYGAYRQIDVTAVDHSGNREIAAEGYVDTREEAQLLADRLNAKETHA